MRHHKMLIAGIVLITAVLLGFFFWEKLDYNQEEFVNEVADETSKQEITNSQNANPVMGNGDANSETNLSTSTDASSIEADLDSTDITGIDSDASELESELDDL